jgi:hypothetical protein
MPKLLDFSNAEQVKNELVPSGTYDVIVDDAEEKVSKSGNDMVVLVLKIQEGEYDGRIIYHNMTFPNDSMESSSAQKMLNFIFTTLRSLGYTEEQLRASDFELDPADLINAEATVVVGKNKPQEGYEPQNVVKRWIVTE